MGENGQPWKLTGFYGHPEVGKRFESWNLLCHLHSYAPVPWLYLGDFNETLADSEKWGGSHKARWQLEAFRDALGTCRLEDLGFVGSRFTWCNKQEGGQFIKERLDQVVANGHWQDLFPFRQVEILSTCTSDQTPIFAWFQWRKDKRMKNHHKFRYEVAWSN